MTWITSPKPESVYIPNESDGRKFGIDISSNQGEIDFAKMAAYTYPKIRFVAARATISWGYKDARFKAYWKAIKETMGVPRAAYGVLYPLQPIAPQIQNFKEQFENQVFDGDIGAPDVELDHGASRAQITNAMIEYANRMQDFTKKPIINYSRFSWIQEFMDYQSSKAVDFIECSYWWMAEYCATKDANGNPIAPYEDTALSIPKALSGLVWNVVIHQTGCKMAGHIAGTTSEQLDTNRWLGTDESFKDIWGASSNVEPQPDTPTTPDISSEISAIREAVNAIEAKVK